VTTDATEVPDPLQPLVQQVLDLYQERRLDDAIALMREVVRRRLPERSRLDSSNLAFLLQQSFNTARDPGILREAIDHATFGLAAFTGDALRLRLARLRMSWRLLHATSSDPAALQGLPYLPGLLADTSDPDCLDHHRQILQDIHQVAGSAEVLADLVTVCRAAHARPRDDSLQRDYDASLLALNLTKLHDTTGDPDARDEAITLLTAVSETAADPGLRSMHMGELALLLESRSIDADDPAETEQAIGLLRRALPLAAPDYRGRHHYNLGNLLSGLARRTGAYAPLAEAVESYRAALPAVRPAERPACVANLASALMDSGVRTGTQEQVDEAVTLVLGELAGPQDVFAEGVLWNTLMRSLSGPRVTADHCLGLAALAQQALPRPGTGDLPAQRQDRICRILTEAGRLTGDEHHLDEAVTAGRKALDLLPPGHKRSYLEANLASALRETGSKRRDRAALSEAVDLMRRALSRTGPDDRDRPRMRGDLASALLVLNGLEHDSGRLTEAIGHAEAAVDAAGTGGSANSLLTLALLLHQRAVNGGNPEAAGLALDRYRQALSLPLGRVRRATLLTNYAGLLRHQAEDPGATAAAADLRGGIDALTEAVAVIPDTLPDLLRTAVSGLTVLPVILLDLDKSDDAHVELALTAWQSALVHAETHGWDDLVTTLLEVTYHARMRRHHHHHGLDDLQQAIACLERTLDLTGDGRPDRAGTQTSLGIAYRIRFGLTGERADLDRAVEAGTLGVDATGADDPARAHRLAHLSAHHRERYVETGIPDDLARAIDLATAALACDPDNDTARSHLADALGERFRSENDPADLSQAIDLLRAIHKETGQDGPDGDSEMDTATRLNNLAGKLLMRYNLFAIPSDLNDGIEAFTASLELTPRTHHAYTSRLINTGQAYRMRADLDEAPPGHEPERSPAADRAQAIAYLEAAVGATHPGTSRHRRAVGALLAVHAGSDQQESTAFGDAIARGLAVVHDEDAADGPDWGHVAHNTALALSSRWSRTGNRDDLDQAIDVLRAAARRDGLHSAPSAQQLGELLARRIEVTEQPGDRAEAAEVLYAVASDLTVPAQLRFRAVRVWFTVADRHDSPRILDGCRLLLELLALAAWPGAPREAQESWLAREGGITAETARLALDAGEPEAAVEFLEQGRAVLWSRVLDSRSDLAEVAEADPDLAARLLAVRDELERLATRFDDDSAAEPGVRAAREDGPGPDPDLMAELLHATELRRTGDRVGMLAVLRELAEADDPWFVAAAECALGITLLENGEAADAELALRRAVATGIGHAAMAAVALGDLLFNRGDLPGARAAYERSAAIGGDPDADERLRGVALAEARQSKASRFADSLIASSDPSLMLNGLQRLYEDREYAEARVLAELLMSRLDARGRAVIGGIVGVVRAQAGDTVGAREALEAALDGPTAGVAAIALGDLLLCEFTAKEARAAYLRGLTAPLAEMAATARSRLDLLAPPVAAPGAQPPLYDYGHHVAHRTPAREGIAALRAAVAAGDTRARTQFYLGELLPPAQKADAYRRAVVLAGPGDDALVLLCRGRLRLARSDHAGGREAFDAAYRKALGSADAELAAVAAVHLAQARESEGDVTAAREAYQRAIQAGHPQHSPAAAFDCAQLLAGMGDTLAAAAVYRSIMATGHPVQGGMAAINLGSIMRDAGDLAGAREAYAHALNGSWPDAATRARVALARLPS
jgi:tetratricopeptide (TPR) repeat protein